MKPTANSAWQFLEPREPLDLNKLNTRIREDVRQLATHLTRMCRNKEVRECRWPGQSGDGRKRGNAAMPWEGASDARLPVIEEVINECKLVMTGSQRAAKLEVKGRNSNGDADAALVTPVLNYVLGTQMRDEVFDEPELMADYAMDHGIGFIHVGWLTRRELEPVQITVDDLLGMALQLRLAEAQEAVPDPESGPDIEDSPAPLSEPEVLQMQMEEETKLWELLLDPAMRGRMVEQLMTYDPQMTKAEARRVIDQLKRDETATYYRPYVRESRPYWEALCLGSDITLPVASLKDVQRAGRVTRWHWKTEAQLRDTALAEGWDDEALEVMIKHPGAMWSDWDQQAVPAWALGAMGVGSAWSQEDAKTAGLYHYAETWSRWPTKAGPSVLYRTLHHASFPARPLLHEVMRDKHGKIPIVALRRETRSKLMLETKGVTALAEDWQSSLKLHHDSRDDNTVLRTTPPLLVPVKRFGSTTGALPIGPWKQLPMTSTSADKIEFLAPPEQPRESASVSEDLRGQVRRYFGLMDKTVPPALTQLHQQALGAKYLRALSAAIDLTFQLCQQYMDPIIGAKVAGMAMPLNATREQIQGEWALELTFDVKDLDIEWLMKKFELLSKMLQFDTGGAVKRGELMKYVFAAADPVLAQRLVIDDEGALDAAYQDETTVISAQMTGQAIRGRYESPMSRLRAHEDWLQNPEALQELGASQSKLLVEIARVETLEFQAEQRTSNAETGRTGEPARQPWQEGQKLSERLRAMFGLARGAEAVMAGQ